MDPRGRKGLENYLKIHKRIDTNLEALNISNLQMSCENALKKKDPGKYLLLKELQNNTEYVKHLIDKYDLADRYKEPYANISSYPKTIQDVSIHVILHSKKKKFIRRRRKSLIVENSKLKQKRLFELIKLMEKKIKFLINGKQLLYHSVYYNIHNTCDNNLLENRLRNFIKVKPLIPPVFELFYIDEDGWHDLRSLVKLLQFCCDRNIRSSEIVLDILLILLKIKVAKGERYWFVPLPHSHNFFRYILQHIQYMEKHDIFFLQTDLKIAWKYLRRFSIANAIVCGDEQRVKNLICYGFKVFPEDERLNTEDRFLSLSQVIPLEHRIILDLLHKIQLYSFWALDFGIILMKTQKNCFLIVLQEFTDFFVTDIDLEESIKKEYDFKMSLNVACTNKYREKKRLVENYKTNFSQFATYPRPKDIFKHFISLPHNAQGRLKRSQMSDEEYIELLTNENILHRNLIIS